jgi:hypothetical protein
MLKSLPHPKATDSSLMKRVPSPTSIITTPGGMSLNLSRPCPSQSSLWDSNFLLLLQFRDREGHLRVPQRHFEDGQKLGTWISRNRRQKRRGALCPEEERRLNEIGFIWNVNDAKFDTMFTALAQFKQREGHCNVSDACIEHLDGGGEFKIGAWLHQQQYQHRIGKLDTKRWKQLESLGVKSKCRRHELGEELFDRNFDLLLVFKEREGHVRVPSQHQESANDYLGSWLGNQRSLHRNGLLELDRQK